MMAQFTAYFFKCAGRIQYLGAGREGSYGSMELFFLALLFLIMMYALGSGYPVAFCPARGGDPTIVIAGVTGYASWVIQGHISFRTAPLNG